jgi:hypothetical protein
MKAPNYKRKMGIEKFQSNTLRNVPCFLHPIFVVVDLQLFAVVRLKEKKKIRKGLQDKRTKNYNN